MSVQGFIEVEKMRLQALFEPFNTQGSWMEVREPGSDPVMLGLVDRYTVTRVAPHFDAAGSVTKTDFWVLFKCAGYDNGWHYAHTVKVVGWSQSDSYMLDLTDDLGRRYHIELIMPSTEPSLVFDWRTWHGYKLGNPDLFLELDAQLLTEHVAIAEAWA